MIRCVQIPLSADLTLLAGSYHHKASDHLNILYRVHWLQACMQSEFESVLFTWSEIAAEK